MQENENLEVSTGAKPKKSKKKLTVLIIVLAEWRLPILRAKLRVKTAQWS